MAFLFADAIFGAARQSIGILSLLPDINPDLPLLRSTHKPICYLSSGHTSAIWLA
jgi:hypothetical protein